MIMKPYIKSLALLLLILVSACSNNETALTESIFDDTTPELSETDVWIRNNFIFPYNIEVLYKWDDNEVDQGRYLFPPEEEKVIPLMEKVKDIWIDSYSELGGDDFIKLVAPRQIVLVGGYNVNSNGSITLGVADSGMKITLFRVNDLDLENIEVVRRFFKTIQHEYCHILNQTKPFSTEFQGITPEDYDGSWTNYSLSEAYDDGFITQYARSSPTEDFAEMTSIILTNSNEEYEAILAEMTTEAQGKIRAKENIVASYFNNEWGINIYELQALNYQKLIN